MDQNAFCDRLRPDPETKVEVWTFHGEIQYTPAAKPVWKLRHVGWEMPRSVCGLGDNRIFSEPKRLSINYKVNALFCRTLINCTGRDRLPCCMGCLAVFRVSPSVGTRSLACCSLMSFHVWRISTDSSTQFPIELLSQTRLSRHSAAAAAAAAGGHAFDRVFDVNSLIRSLVLCHLYARFGNDKCIRK